MALSALDMEPSSPSPVPEGAAAPPSGDAAEHTPASEAASPKLHAPAKPPAASLLGISLKGKAAGPAKAGDLTRFFELAHRQTKAPPKPAAGPPLEATTIPTVELEGTPQPPASAAPPIDTPVAEAPLEPAPLDAAPPALAETTVSAEAVIASEATLEPSFPLLLAPPAAVEIGDATAAVSIEAPPAPTPETDELAIPDWLRSASTDESAFAPETAEPLKVALVPMEETPTATGATDEPAGTMDVPQQDTPAAAVAAPAALDPPADPAELLPEASTPVVAAPVEPEIAPAEPAPAPELVPVAAARVEPAPQPQPLPDRIAPVEPVPAPEPAAPRTPTFKELVDYWRSLRSGDGHPAAELIDRDLVTERWPGALLIAYTPASQDPRGELRPGRVTRLGSACTETQSVVDAGSHSTEWMLEVARTALVNDEPVEEHQRLATIKGVAGFRMVALPLGPPRALPTAVLCSLMPSPGAPRFGKRRIWL